MINIVQIGFSYKVGGIEKNAINSISSLPKKDYRFFFINVFEEANDEKFIKDMKKLGTVINLPNYRKHPIKFIKEFKRVHKVYQFDILHYNMASAVYLTPLIAAKKCGIKTIIAHSHNNASDKGLLKAIIHNINKKLVTKYANKYFACSESAGEWMFSKSVRNSNEYHIMYNGINVNNFLFDNKKRETTRRELKVKKEETLYVHIGRFMPIKNHDFLIDVFNEILSKEQKSKLLLIGNGDTYNKINNKVKKLGIQDKVIFMGEIDEINNYLNASDCFILPSINEGLGIVLVEAQANGLCCVASENIPAEAEINHNFYRLSLEKGVKYWAEKIVSINKERHKNSEKMLNYDIANSSKKLDLIYKNSIKIKIGHFVYGIKNGGVEKVILNYFSNINRDNYDLHIISQGESDKNSLEEFINLGFKVHIVTKKGKSIIKNYTDIRKILKNERFDIIHCHMSDTNFFPLLYGKMYGVKHRISHSHNALTNKKLMNKILCSLSKLVDTNRFACSNDAALWLFGTKKNVFIMTNAIEIDRYSYNTNQREKIRKKLNYKNNEIVIGCIARFEKQKNHEFLIEVFKELNDKDKNIKLLLIGTGSLEDNIKKKVEKYNLTKYTTFIGTTNEANIYYQAMDVFLLPSLHEGLALTLVEAQASDLPVFTSDTVSTESKMSDYFYQYSLNSRAIEWSNDILKTYKELPDRDKRKNKVAEYGFDIRKACLALDEYYKSLIRGEK